MKFSNEMKNKIMFEMLYDIEAGKFSYQKIVETFDISRQTVGNYLKELMEQKIIKREEKNNYQLVTTKKIFGVDLKELHEDVIYKDNIASMVKHLPDNVQRILEYIFTEMLNNAIDHSQSENAVILFKINHLRVLCTIGDNGVGIFKNIKEKKGLRNEKGAIFELKKGKLTTDEKRHTGEGIFFSSRAADYFRIDSFGEIFKSSQSQDVMESSKKMKNISISTGVSFLINCNSTKVLNDVFSMYTDDEPSFSKTNVIVHLFEDLGESLMSRSQAKRFLNNLDKFKEITLDYSGVEVIGQGFADQVYRVFVNEYQDIKINNINTNSDIDFMIKHVTKKN